MPSSTLSTKPGQLQIRVYTGRNASGKPQYYCETFHGTKKEAQKRLTALLRQLDTQTLPNPESFTVGEYLDHWLQAYARQHVRPRTFESYELHVRQHLKPALGGIPLAKLSPLHIDTYYTQAQHDGRKDGKPGGLSPTTVRRIHTTLRQALKHAVEWGYLAKNPADSAHPPRVQKQETLTWSPAELNRFLKAASQTRWYALFFTLGYTGMRLGEILGLKWKWVRFDEGLIYVRETLIRGGRNPLFGEPKSATSRREIPITAALLKVLKSHKARQDEEKLLLGSEYHDFDLVFCTSFGTALSKSNLFKEAWKPLLKKAGVPEIRIHDLRHGFATMMLENGQDPKLLSELLGHHSVAFTLDTYVHPKQDSKRQAMESLSRLMLGQ